MTRKIRTDFALPSISTLGRDRINVDNHDMLVNFIAGFAKRDKHASGCKSKASGKRKKGKAHKRGPSLLLKTICNTSNQLQLITSDYWHALFSTPSLQHFFFLRA